MNSVKRKLTLPSLHADASTFLLLVIRFEDWQTKVFTKFTSHGTADNFLQDKDGNKTWNIESLVTEVIS